MKTTNRNRKNHNFQITYRGHYILEIPDLKYKHLAYCCEGEGGEAMGDNERSNNMMKLCFADCPCQAGEIHTHCILVTIDPISINQLYRDLLPFLKPSNYIEGEGEGGQASSSKMKNNEMLVEKEKEKEEDEEMKKNSSLIQNEEEELWMDIRCYKHWQTMFHQHIGLGGGGGSNTSSRPSCGSNFVWITPQPYHDVQSYQLQVRQHQPTALKNQLILAYGPLQAVQKGLISLYQYSQLKKSYSEYLADLQDEQLSSAEPIKPGPKKRHYWLYGDSNTGKTTWCINQANQLSRLRTSSSSSSSNNLNSSSSSRLTSSNSSDPASSSIEEESLLYFQNFQNKKKKANTHYFMVPRNNDWCFYDNQKHIIIDEFDGTLYTISQLQEMVDAKCFTVNTKGGSKLLTPDVIFYITSRYPPEGCYPEKIESLSHPSHHHHQHRNPPHSSNNTVARAAHNQDVQGLYNRFFVHQMTFVYPSSSTSNNTVGPAASSSFSDQLLPPKKSDNSSSNGDNNDRGGGKILHKFEGLCPQYGFQFFEERHHHAHQTNFGVAAVSDEENTKKVSRVEEEEQDHDE
jgi:hypothetical protein